MSDTVISASLGANNLDEVLRRDGVIASTTVGVSMRPLFRTRRDVVVIRAASGAMRKYDVVLYRVGEKLIFHRIVGIDTDRGLYRIRGDNTYKLELVPYDSVIGVLESFNRKGKHIDVTDKGYRLYSRVWSAIYPIRYTVRLPYVLARRVLRPIKRAIKGKRA